MNGSWEVCKVWLKASATGGQIRHASSGQAEVEPCGGFPLTLARAGDMAYIGSYFYDQAGRRKATPYSVIIAHLYSSFTWEGKVPQLCGRNLMVGLPVSPGLTVYEQISTDGNATQLIHSNMVSSNTR